MKYLFIFSLVLLSAQATHAQSSSRRDIIGKWWIKKAALPSGIIIDLEHKGAAHDSLTKMLKMEKNNLGLDPGDSAQMEIICKQILNSLDSVFLELKPDKTWMAHIPNKSVFDIDEGTYKYDEARSELELGTSNQRFNLLFKGHLSNDNLLQVIMQDPNNLEKPITLTFRKAP